MKDPAEALTLALAANDAHGWGVAMKQWRRQVSSEKRMALAVAALSSLGAGEAALVMRAYQGGGAGPPIAPLISQMDEANFWSDLATRDELKAYAVACFDRMTDADRDAFLVWARGRAAA